MCGRNFIFHSKEVQRLRVFGNRVLRIILVAGRRKVHSEECCNLYFTPNIIYVIK